LPENESCIDFLRLDSNGEKLSGRKLIVKEKGFFSRAANSNLLKLFRKIETKDTEKKPQILLAKHGGENPERLLEEEPHLQWQILLNRVLVDLKAEQNQEE